MRNKGFGIFVLITVISAATCFIVQKLLKKKNFLESAKLKYLNKDYQGSIEDYKKALDQENDKIEIYNGISMCLIKLKHYNDALKFLNQSLEIKIRDNLKALKWRSECYKLLGFKRLHFKDLVLKYKLVMKHEVPLEKLETELIREDAQKYVENNSLIYSNVLYSDFFSTFEGVLGTDDLSVEIKNGNFENLNKKLMKFGWEKSYKGNDFINPKIIRSCLFFLKESFTNAFECCGTPENFLERLLKEFFRFKAFNALPDISIFNSQEIVDTKNPTLIFYYAKLLILKGNTTEYVRLLNTIRDYSFVAYELLLLNKKNGWTDYHLQLTENTRCLVLIGEYAIEKGDKELLKNILTQMHDSDVRCLLFKAEISYARRDLDYTVHLLRKAIKLDSTCFKAFFNLGEILSQKYPEQSASIWKEVLSKVSNMSEVMIMMHIFLCLECKEYVDKHLGTLEN